MSFIHPELLIMGAGLTLIPVIIHWLHRRRFVTQPWAAMDFVLAAYQRSRRRLHLEHWLLLAVRMLVIALLAICIARPFVNPGSVFSAVGQKRCDRVVVLDNAFSMRARRSGGETSFDVARKNIVRFIEQMASGDRISIVTTAGPQKTVIGAPIGDSFAALRAAEQVEPSWAAKDWADATKAAIDALGERKGSALREVVVLTDLAGLGSDRGAAAFQDVDRVSVVNVVGDSRENLAVTGLWTKSQILGRGLPVRVAASIANYGTIDRQNVPVIFTVDGGQVFKRNIEHLGAGKSQQVEIDFVPNRAGGHVIHAHLENIQDDVLIEDNSRDFAINIRERISVLLVDGRANAAGAEQELFYFRTALQSQAGEEADSGFNVRNVSPADLSDQILRDYDVIVLGNVRELSESASHRLTRFVAEGGGLIVFCGDRVEPDVYASAGFMPARLEVVASASNEKERLGLQLHDVESPILSDFLGQQRSILGSSMAQSYWKIKSGSMTSDARVLMNLTNGDPLALTSHLGRGHVITWLSGANLAWTNLPAKPDYLPLVLNMTANAAGDDVAGRNVNVGDPIIQALRTCSGGCAVSRPDKTIDIVNADATQTQQSYRKTDLPGVYQFRSAEGVSPAAVHLDERGSNLRPGSAEQIAAVFGKNVVAVKDLAAVSGPSNAQSGAEPAPFFAVALLILLCCESLMADRFGNRG